MRLNLKHIIAIALSFFILNACQKGCLTSTGEEITTERIGGEFNHIQIWDNVDVQITQSDENRIQVKAGENIIDDIETRMEEGVLIIRNNNTCNWMRSYTKKIEVQVEVKQLYEIEMRGVGEISSTNAINSDSLMLNVWDAAGKVDLTIDTKKSTIRYHIGTADIIYRGKTRLSYISSNSYGPVDARDLESEQTYISTIGSNNNYVWATEILEATVGSIGNIYYKGDPKILKTFFNGSGKIEKIEP